MEVILSKQCKSPTGSVGRGYGYSIQRRCVALRCLADFVLLSASLFNRRRHLTATKGLTKRKASQSDVTPKSWTDY